jgi:hypothetical protein
MESKQKGPKMMQVNVMDNGKGKLTINIRRKGFNDHEVIGILEMAKGQVLNMMKTKMEHNLRFGSGPGKGDMNGKAGTGK